MKQLIESISQRVRKIRNTPDMAPTHLALALNDIAEGFKQIDERLENLERIASTHQVAIAPGTINSDELEALMASPSAYRPMPLLTGADAAAQARSVDWAIGAKV